MGWIKLSLSKMGQSCLFINFLRDSIWVLFHLWCLWKEHKTVEFTWSGKIHLGRSQKRTLFTIHALQKRVTCIFSRGRLRKKPSQFLIFFCLGQEPQHWLLCIKTTKEVTPTKGRRDAVISTHLPVSNSWCAGLTVNESSWL